MEKVDPRLLLIRVVKILDQLKITYIVTGGIAVLVYGRPRFTADVDIVIEMEESKISILEKTLMSLGKYGYIDKEAIAGALKNKGEFNFIDGFTGVKVDFWVTKGDEISRSEFRRKNTKIVLRNKINFISPEDLILRKIVWYKESYSNRHLEDAESIIRISGKKLDKTYLKKMAARMNISEELNNLLKQ